MKIVKSKRAVSPVIATIILVAVTITITVAISYWISSVSSGYTRFERVELVGAFSEYDTYGWNVSIVLRNMGTKDVILSDIKVNDKISYLYDPVVTSNATNGPLAPGKTTLVYIFIPNEHFSRGLMVNIEMMTASGYSYQRLVELA